MRRRGYVPCNGPHADDDRRAKRVGDLLCSVCWFRLPAETRRRLKLSGGSGRPNPVIRFMELRQQLADGVPLEQIEVSGDIPPGVIACGPDGRQQQLPPEDVAVVEAFADHLKRREDGA